MTNPLHEKERRLSSTIKYLHQKYFKDQYYDLLKLLSEICSIAQHQNPIILSAMSKKRHNISCSISSTDGVCTVDGSYQCCEVIYTFFKGCLPTVIHGRIFIRQFMLECEVFILIALSALLKKDFYALVMHCVERLKTFG